MTQPSTTAPAPHVPFTIASLEGLSQITEADYLELLDWTKTELEALEAGMHGQTGEQRRLQNRSWSAQREAQLKIVKAALKAGVPAAAITAITHRESW
jgi:hypothetical protein